MEGCSETKISLGKGQIYNFFLILFGHLLEIWGRILSIY